MNFIQKRAYLEFTDEVSQLFYQRTLICLWLGIVFFSLFSFLDYFCCRDFFSYFLFLRFLVVATLAIALGLLRFSSVASHTPLLMYVIFLVATLSISLMTLKLGGFTSNYYVGILLMIAGGISVLPLRISQAFFYGFSMYAVYMLTILFGKGLVSSLHTPHGVINTFFFATLISGTAIQSLDDMQVLLKSLLAKNNIRKIRQELTGFTDNLENLVQMKMAEQAETDLKFRDLYNNLMDLAILIDKDGVIQMTNEHSHDLIGLSPEELKGSNIREYVQLKDLDGDIVTEILTKISMDKNLQSTQLLLKNVNGVLKESELSGNRVDIEKDATFYQLIFRDISIIKHMERQLLESERIIDSSRQAAIFGLAKLAETRDDDTGAHLDRIRFYVHILARELKDNGALNGTLSKDFLEDIYLSSVLHDIGKVGIPDRILLKPGKLTQEEFDLMKSHCAFGYTTLKNAETESENTSFLQMGQDITLYHHEKWDGSGYPMGLAGDKIPIAARIVALADVYDALTTSRVYKPAYDHEFSKEIIMQGRGHHFDPDVVDAFYINERQFRQIRSIGAVE